LRRGFAARLTASVVTYRDTTGQVLVPVLWSESVPFLVCFGLDTHRYTLHSMTGKITCHDVAFPGQDDFVSADEFGAKRLVVRKRHCFGVVAHDALALA
jgi:hypothetical protein